MAIHANSIPAPERTLLWEVAAPGRLLPGPVNPAHALDLLAINDRVAALFNPAKLSEGEPGDFDGPFFETMRECQDDELASLEAQRVEIEAKREGELLAILDMGPIDPTAMAFMSATERKRAQAGIDALLDYLDAVTPDANLEDDGCAEPYMSLPETGAGNQPVRFMASDECEPDGDGEPSLGAAIVGSLYQTLWSRGSHQDLEEQNEDGDTLDDGEHDSSDYEPSLGAPVGSLHHHDMWQHNSLSAFEDEIDWENEEDERSLPGYREGMRILEVA